jgi:hypothetical protein
LEKLSKQGPKSKQKKTVKPELNGTRFFY